MAVFKCKMCGGTIEFAPGESVGICDSCGTKQTLPRLDSDKKAQLYDRADHFRRNNEFDKAMGIYEQILNEDEDDAEAYWSLVLCKYGIEYVEDPATHRRIPTVNRAQYTSIFDDEDYKAALRHADGHQREIYEQEAGTINEIQKGILAISAKEEPFDVFICYKETDANGRRTPDSVLANDLYHQLTQEGFKVFFARITLEDKLGSAYEPYIFAALNSAKVMVVLGTRPAYFQAAWVKNEWSRYLALVKESGGKKILIPAYKDMDPYDLPEEFSHLQAQDMSKLGFMQDLIRGIKKIVSSTDIDKVSENAPKSGASVEAIIDRALLLIEDGENEKAIAALEQALNMAPKHPMIYVAKLMLETGVRRQEELAELDESFENSPNYEKAIRFADPQLKEKLHGYVEKINYNCIKGMYLNALQQMSSATTEEDYVCAQNLFLAAEYYEDAKQKAEECANKATIARNERIYFEACELLNATALNKIADYKEAIEKFSSIHDYKDSHDRIDECTRKIAQEEERIAAKKKKNKRIVAIIIPALCVVVAITIVYFTVLVPKQNYEKAEELFSAAQYSEAYEAYTELGDYNDSVDKAKECLYIQATNFRNEKNWDSANELFEKIKDYKDSKDLLHYHSFKETGSKEATCTAAGYTDYVCDCGETKHRDFGALGHSYSSATCTAPKKCSRCGVTSGSALGHTSGGTKCSRCGAVTFKTLTFSGSGQGVIKNINLPNGNFIIKARYIGKRNFVSRFYESESAEYWEPISNEIGSCEVQVKITGPANNGYIEIVLAEGSWTFTIEVM